MRVTLETIQKFADNNGLEPFYIDGIPEGFSWIKKNLRQIVNAYDYGHLIAFRPNEEWFNNSKVMCYKPIIISSENPTQEEIDLEIGIMVNSLLNLYKK